MQYGILRKKRMPEIIKPANVQNSQQKVGATSAKCMNNSEGCVCGIFVKFLVKEIDT